MDNLNRRLEKLEATAPSPCADPFHSDTRYTIDYRHAIEPLAPEGWQRTDPAPPVPVCPTCGKERQVIRIEYIDDWRGDDV